MINTISKYNMYNVASCQGGKKKEAGKGDRKCQGRDGIDGVAR